MPRLECPSGAETPNPGPAFCARGRRPSAAWDLSPRLQGAAGARVQAAKSVALLLLKGDVGVRVS